MAKLLRVILIHAHLPGVVEIQLDEHSNICGTNASGKTTLQRLVPVFYGEQPNKVVPRTRKKFDKFYLPWSNSYIIYEYQRETGNSCLVVLTGKNEGGVEYRFVSAPYHPDLFLRYTEDGAKGLSYNEWSAQMRNRDDVSVSVKIGSTTEYRSIIQNDVASLRGNSTETMRLRRLAASFSLVSGNYKLRHIEKLVSAVHAGEGKMETLKTMLAAIFADDGVTLPQTKVKSSFAREWIQKMRQSLRYDKLQQDFELLQRLGLKLDDTEAQLVALHPLLRNDEQTQKQKKADAEQQLNQRRGELTQLEDCFNQQSRELNDQLSKTQSELKTVLAWLDHVQEENDRYERKDIRLLQTYMDELPQWREALSAQSEQYRLMQDQMGELSRKFEQHKAKLQEAFYHQNQLNQQKTQDCQREKEVIRDKFDCQKEVFRQRFEEQKQQQENHYGEQLAIISRDRTAISIELKHSQLTAEENGKRQIAELRIEQAQECSLQLGDQRQNAQTKLSEARKQQYSAEKQLHDVRAGLHQAEEQLLQLHRQRDPEQGTLRYFLRVRYEGWEQNLGKVLNENLLERKDLQPDLRELSESLYGLQLELSVLDMPDFAQDEASIRYSLDKAEQIRAHAEEAKKTAEASFQEHHQNVRHLQSQADECERQYQRQNQEVGYARDARTRLIAEHKVLEQERRQEKRARLSALEKAHTELTQQQEQDLRALTDEHNAQMLQWSVDLQSEQQLIDEKIEELSRQINKKRADMEEQIRIFQQALDDDLAKKGIDPREVKILRERIDTLKKDIQAVEERRDELTEWQRFIKLDWEQLRPEKQKQEGELSQQKRELLQSERQLKAEYQNKKDRLNDERKQYDTFMRQAGELVSQLKVLLDRLLPMPLAEIVPAYIDSAADINERMSRTSDMLEQHASVTRTLESKLNEFKSRFNQDAAPTFLELLDSEIDKLPDPSRTRQQLPVLEKVLQLLKDKQQQLLEMGENIGGDLKKFFDVFSDINRRISQQSRRLSDAVTDDLQLEGINKSEVRILSTIDQLRFWKPLKRFAKSYSDWRSSGQQLPPENYLNALMDVVELLHADERFTMESLLNLELHLNEGGEDIVIRNDRQLLEASSHGMAYLILCKYLLAFTRLLRGKSDAVIHWPIDEIGTLAYHNVEKLFIACSHNNIVIVGAFPNAESDVLMLFKHRYLLDADQLEPTQRRLKRIQPKVSRLTARLAQRKQEAM
ncbi:ATP-binding protein [Salmonella enterica]|uniref:ATP-binding protein n=1 Tax=Salmonella TaxID=590 RepID=UPI00034B862C|nr:MULTISPECIES: ATP-binding protein [Salmonella]EBU0430694.1 ATP-binding protein [Salmonella enterica]ECM8012263.1 ATP-binding protein [Salmonella enterica subsp. enterica serovar Newport]ECV9049682.1 ATP-binding protein [Salmonella enterica subsp. enterica serovar Newport]EGP3502174.1 ATP-binding protein [Salmonella enterica subsp. enterica serovar Newport]EKY5349833.1 ATP-binding protein [Salmonella enterica]